MIKIEIYFRDLGEAKQRELEEKLGKDGNWDLFPLTMLEVEEMPMCNARAEEE
jgi:hypothetical protein